LGAQRHAVTFRSLIALGLHCSRGSARAQAPASGANQIGGIIQQLAAAHRAAINSGNNGGYGHGGYSGPGYYGPAGYGYY
jgi:hypothetical protein